MRRFDIMTLTSRADPFPLVVLEAMLLGTPVVAFNVGGVSEQIGDAGIVVPSGDVEGMANAVIELTRDPHHRRELGRRARARAEEMFPTGAFYERLLTLMREIDRDCYGTR
jgi:glycosyltransferase involved in cell wall biosynthesis